jgi:hypothetical protein
MLYSNINLFHAFQQYLHFIFHHLCFLCSINILHKTLNWCVFLFQFKISRLPSMFLIILYSSFAQSMTGTSTLLIKLFSSREVTMHSNINNASRDSLNMHKKEWLHFSYKYILKVSVNLNTYCCKKNVLPSTLKNEDIHMYILRNRWYTSIELYGVTSQNTSSPSLWKPKSKI